ncbi:MAG: lipopolysaccharide heptosyltransferase II, partial [Ignavibacteriales bacterium]
KYLIPYNFKVHEVQRNLDLIAFNYDNESWKIKPELKINLQATDKIQTFIKENNIEKNFIVIAPGSIWNSKKYPVEYYSEIIAGLQKKGYSILLIGGENDKPVCEKLAAKNGSVSVAGVFSIVESIELLKYAKLLISNDSAPTHMGMCADIPVLTLYCSTSFEFGFYPYNAKSSYLSYDDLFCKPCGIHGYEKCPIGTFDCGYLLKPGIVISKLEKMLND